MRKVRAAMSDAPDRNFDDLAERFARRVYGGLKGEIRLAVLWSDLQPCIDQRQRETGAPLRVLDVGCGLGQLAIRLAERGHRVTCNDLSSVMLGKARQSARAAGVEQDMEWIEGPWQLLQERLETGFDLIMCHALLEWLQAPARLVAGLTSLLSGGGYLSLCFYNPAARRYRNLIRGNFDWIKQEQSYRADAGSLTPNNACSLDQVRGWLRASHYEIVSESGLRVFHDYVVEQRGGHRDPEQVLAMELEYSGREPFKWLGRYLHIVARRGHSSVSSASS